MIQSNQVIPESDTLVSIEDTSLFWIFRNGRQLQRTWNELTHTEKRYQQEAAQRAAYNASFAPNGGEIC